jgi:hypothetical protein
VGAARIYLALLIFYDWIRQMIYGEEEEPSLFRGYSLLQLPIYFLSLRSKYFPQHSVLKRCQSIFFSLWKRKILKNSAKTATFACKVLKLVEGQYAEDVI